MLVKSKSGVSENGVAPLPRLEFDPDIPPAEIDRAAGHRRSLPDVRPDSDVLPGHAETPIRNSGTPPPLPHTHTHTRPKKGGLVRYPPALRIRSMAYF